MSHDRERGRVSLSTKKLEPTPGDMIRNPKLVFEKVFFLLAGVIFPVFFVWMLLFFVRSAYARNTNVLIVFQLLCFHNGEFH